jgi:hypothetical protein
MPLPLSLQDCAQVRQANGGMEGSGKTAYVG